MCVVVTCVLVIDVNVEIYESCCPNFTLPPMVEALAGVSNSETCHCRNDT